MNVVTKVSSRLLSAKAEIIGDEKFSSIKILTQMKYLFTVSKYPAIAHVPSGAEGNAAWDVEVIFTYPPLKRNMSSFVFITVYH